VVEYGILGRRSVEVDQQLEIAALPKPPQQAAQVAARARRSTLERLTVDADAQRQDPRTLR
jgi:hypothetical protein